MKNKNIKKIVEFEHLSIMAAIMWEILALLAGAILLALTLFILNPRTWLWYSLLWLLGAVMIGVTMVYVPFLYLNAEFAINEKAIIYKKGVFFTSTSILYRDRIAFVTVYNNPLTPILKISSLAITAAGGNMTILFLNSKRATELANLLSKEKAGF